jgi:hypothetical protein
MRQAVERKRTSWDCLCDCGAIVTVRADALTSGGTKSCGCLSRELAREHIKKAWVRPRVVHGHTRGSHHGADASPEYRSWRMMKSRCLNPRNHKFASYGGRGIAVCQPWLDFRNFLADMGRRPSLLHTLDRIDNDGNYEPGNCRWATRTEQQRNTRTACRVFVMGAWMSLGDVADVAGMPVSCLKYRLRQGWSLGRALAYRAATAQEEADYEVVGWVIRELAGLTEAP